MADDANRPPNFLKAKHVKFFQRYLQCIPTNCVILDTTRLTIAFFAISGLDLLQSLDVLESEKKLIVDWIYSLQVLPSGDESSMSRCGFRGSTVLNVTKKEQELESKLDRVPYDSGHMTMTYTGLASLIILGDDLSRVNKEAIVTGLRALQNPDGSYVSMVDGSESDLRFVYCAAAISYILQDWRGINIPLTIQYIRDSLSYDHGIGNGHYSESHGGLTYCAIATLTLLGKLHTAMCERELQRLVRWCVFRQQSGFHGRPNKQEDTCYSFWLGATLKMLDSFHLANYEQNREFILSTQNPTIGGLAKYPEKENSPDALHSYAGLGGLALLGEMGIAPINPALNISVRATEHLHRLHEEWQQLRCVTLVYLGNVCEQFADNVRHGEPILRL